MIIKILSSSADFAAVRYNTAKIDSGLGELMVARNFGALDHLSGIRPQDYIHYFKLLAAGNSRLSKPQFHAVISADGKSVSASDLAALAERWLDKMGYGSNPYLIVFHGDTDNHHVHLVSCRVDREGKKIPSGFERIRAVAAIHTLLGINTDLVFKKDIHSALSFRFSTAAQFSLLLERKGYGLREVKGMLECFKYGKVLGCVPLEKINGLRVEKSLDNKRAAQLKKLFLKYLPDYSGRPVAIPNTAHHTLMPPRYSSDFAVFAAKKLGLDIIFHSAQGKVPYGYTIIDHSAKCVFKGSEVMPLKEMISIGTASHGFEFLIQEQSAGGGAAGDIGNGVFEARDDESVEGFAAESFLEDLPPLELKDDIDDEAVLGRNRARKGKARTNTR